MASGHVNRIYRPNTWLHRPMLQNVKKALARTPGKLPPRKKEGPFDPGEMILSRSIP